MTTIPTSILIKKASLEYDKTANRFLEPYKISNSQFKLLKYLFRQPELTVTQRDLEYYFYMTNPTVTGLLQNMEKKDLIVRVKNPNDGRSKVIGLTEKCLAIKEDLLNLGAAIDQMLLKNLNQEEQEQLNHLLSQLLKN